MNWTILFLAVLLATLIAVLLLPFATLSYTADDEPEAFWAEVTAYSEIDSCHYENCTMANNIPAQIGYIACPRNIELGTLVEIEGVKYECGDRYNKDLSYRFDIFMGYGKESYKVAKAFGIQTLAVKIIE